MTSGMVSFGPSPMAEATCSGTICDMAEATSSGTICDMTSRFEF